MRSSLYLGVLLMAGVIFSACSFPGMNNTKDTSMSGTTMEGQTVVVNEATLEVAEKMADEVLPAADRQLSLDAFNYEYSQERIGVKPGETIEIKLTSTDGFHNFVIDSLDVESDVVMKGQSTSVMVTIPADAKPGDSYGYYCSVMNHRALGMVGSLVVENTQ